MAYTGEYQIPSSRDGSDTVLIVGRPVTSGPATAARKSTLVEGRVAQMKAKTAEGGAPAVRGAAVRRLRRGIPHGSSPPTATGVR